MNKLDLNQELYSTGSEIECLSHLSNNDFCLNKIKEFERRSLNDDKIRSSVRSPSCDNAFKFNCGKRTQNKSEINSKLSKINRSIGARSENCDNFLKDDISDIELRGRNAFKLSKDDISVRSTNSSKIKNKSISKSNSKSS